MTQLSEIYNQRILELSANIAGAQRLDDADGTATAHSKLCGSTVTVDLKMDGDRVQAFGQTVKACLLGQAAASVMGRNIVGTDASELRDIGGIMRRMLKQGGPPPAGRWADLAVLEPVKDYKARHASTLLVFDAVESADARNVGGFGGPGGDRAGARGDDLEQAVDRLSGARRAVGEQLFENGLPRRVQLAVHLDNMVKFGAQRAGRAVPPLPRIRIGLKGRLVGEPSPFSLFHGGRETSPPRRCSGDRVTQPTAGAPAGTSGMPALQS